MVHVLVLAMECGRSLSHFHLLLFVTWVLAAFYIVDNVPSGTG